MLKNQLKNYHIILASGSPRRQQFFKDLGLDFEVRLKEVEEVYPPELQHREITEYLAVLKSDALADSLQENDLLITSDTIVWHNGMALGKPANRDEAVEMLSLLSGSTHEVVSSVCFRTINHSDLISEVTRVSINPIGREVIEYYVDTFKPYDKAGAYGIQEWIGLVGVSRIEGSYANVMGLPVDKVFQYLSKLT